MLNVPLNGSEHSNVPNLLLGHIQSYITSSFNSIWFAVLRRCNLSAISFWDLSQDKFFVKDVFMIHTPWPATPLLLLTLYQERKSLGSLDPPSLPSLCRFCVFIYMSLCLLTFTTNRPEISYLVSKSPSAPRSSVSLSISIPVSSHFKVLHQFVDFFVP